MKSTIIVLAFALLLPNFGYSQTPANVRRIAVGEYEADIGRLGTHARLYYRGLYDSLAVVLREDLATARYQESHQPDFLRAYSSIVFVARPPAEKDGTLVRVILPPSGPALPLPYRLPGIVSFYDVFLSLDPAASYEAAWVSTSEPPPYRAQLVKLAETAIVPLSSILEAAEIFGFDTSFIVPVRVLVDHVELPHRRGLIRVSARATNAVPGSVVRVVRAADDLSAELSRGAAWVSPCAAALSERLHAELTGALAYAMPIMTVSDRMAISERVSAAASARLKEPVCAAEVRESDNGVRTSAAITTAARYLALISTDAAPVRATAEIRNARPQRVSIGLVGGAMLSRSGDTNFEVIDKGLHQKPLSGLVSAGVVHIHPSRFDPFETSISNAERYSVFAGLTATPSAGFIGGISARLFRGVGFQVAHAWMRANRLKPEFAAGDSAPVGRDPFRLGFTNSVVFGISYELK